MEKFPLITFIFILLWIIFSFEVACIILGIATIAFFVNLIKFLYKYNPRRKAYYDNNEKPPGT